MAGHTTYHQQAKIFMALADPTRLQMVALLAGCQEMSSSLLAERLNISLSLACHHTKNLAEAGLVEKRREGQTVYHMLNRTLLVKSLEHLIRLTDTSNIDPG